MTPTVAPPVPFSTAALEAVLEGIESAEATTRVPHHTDLHVYTDGVVVEVGAETDLDAWARWCGPSATLAGSCRAAGNGHLVEVYELTASRDDVPVRVVCTVLVRCPDCEAEQ